MTDRPDGLAGSIAQRRKDLGYPRACRWPWCDCVVSNCGETLQRAAERYAAGNLAGRP